MKVSIDKTKKTITIELPLISPPRESGSGKTLLVASTGGNKETDAVINDQSVYVGCNAYIYATPKAASGASAKG